MTRDFDGWDSKYKGTFEDETCPKSPTGIDMYEPFVFSSYESYFKYRIEKHEKLIKELKEWKNGLGEEVHKLDHVMILNRIDKLEQRKDGLIDNDLQGLALEQHNNRLKKLEARKDLEEKCASDESAMKGMFIQELQNRVKALEEWTFNHGPCPSDRLPNPSGDMCVKRKIRIDREIWEEIKSAVSNLDEWTGCSEHFTKLNQFQYLKDAIKKVEPSWEPNKK